MNNGEKERARESERERKQRLEVEERERREHFPFFFPSTRSHFLSKHLFSHSSPEAKQGTRGTRRPFPFSLWGRRDSQSFHRWRARLQEGTRLLLERRRGKAMATTMKLLDRRPRRRRQRRRRPLHRNLLLVLLLSATPPGGAPGASRAPWDSTTSTSGAPSPSPGLLR